LRLRRAVGNGDKWLPACEEGEWAHQKLIDHRLRWRANLKYIHLCHLCITDDVPRDLLLTRGSFFGPCAASGCSFSSCLRLIALLRHRLVNTSAQNTTLKAPPRRPAPPRRFLNETTAARSKSYCARGPSSEVRAGRHAPSGEVPALCHAQPQLAVAPILRQHGAHAQGGCRRSTRRHASRPAFFLPQHGALRTDFSFAAGSSR
jgi:hypothetical protein